MVVGKYNFLESYNVNKACLPNPRLILGPKGKLLVGAAVSWESEKNFAFLYRVRKSCPPLSGHSEFFKVDFISFNRSVMSVANTRERRTLSRRSPNLEEVPRLPMNQNPNRQMSLNQAI
jgi:hypothetical protein